VAFVQLTVIEGGNPGETLHVPPGRQATVGRLREKNQLAVPDRFMAPVHFVLQSDDSRCTLQDSSLGLTKHARCARGCFLHELRNSQCPPTLCGTHDLSGENGVYVNGQRTSHKVLQDGDVVVAGSSAFTVQVTDQPSVPHAPTPATPNPHKLKPSEHKNAMAALQQPGLMLYAMLDAARDPRVLQLLRTHSELFYSLYDGAEGERYGDVAPYLVELSPASRLCDELVREHWGQSFGSFLFSQADFKTVRRHLRKFLKVENEARKEMLFRFYDPRVLRAFLPTCSREQCAEFFGPISFFLTEAEQQRAGLVFSFDGAGARTEVVRL
jgi:pSer/pThr/pTyr-binding forkhead associated (FHA) protein